MAIKKVVREIRKILNRYKKELETHVPEKYSIWTKIYGNGYNHFPENIEKDLIDLGLTITSIRLAEGKPLE